MAELLEIADELYGLPLAEFTPARDARAKELKGTDLAPRVKALRKPSTAAWVVNLLMRRETEQVDQVLAEEPRLVGGRTERWAERPVTKFERRGIAEGRPITDWTVRRAD